MPLLTGKPILIVEDDPLIALDLVATVEKAGGTVIGPALNLPAALRLAQSEAIAAAVLDVRLYSGRSQPVAECLERRGIPFLFQTGHPGEARQYSQQAPVLDKPVAPAHLIDVLARLIARARI